MGYNGTIIATLIGGLGVISFFNTFLFYGRSDMIQESEQQSRQICTSNANAMCCGASDCETSKRLNVHCVRKQKKFTKNINFPAIRMML